MPLRKERLCAHTNATKAYQDQVSQQFDAAAGKRQVPLCRWPWLDHLADDRALPPQAARGKDGIARFKVAELAETLGTVYATAYTTMRALLDGGYLVGAGVRNRGCAFSLAIPRGLEGGEA